ncbi:hypothetical protein [Lapillicoccus jejuensis]|uniref:GNAT family N-acetyltransferase n=1 Tax=Lapillicoccus jejuensis TaxID=402171 RepID=A0A542E0S6_9MICO|nr:hypothetical protein [Lapillicoccus jejuensis]TQJ08926.1 hypothetical protein FB458_2027 [Lapillicoccus jejuensis]
MSAAQPVREPLRVRRASGDDALVVGALRLQAARAAGAPAEPGFLDRFARVWDAQAHPTWVAEHAGRHAGVLIARVVADLPWPGVVAAARLETVTLFVAADAAPYDAEVRAALTAALRGWAREVGHTVAA